MITFIASFPTPTAVGHLTAAVALNALPWGHCLVRPASTSPTARHTVCPTDSTSADIHHTGSFFFTKLTHT